MRELASLARIDTPMDILGGSDGHLLTRDGLEGGLYLR